MLRASSESQGKTVNVKGVIDPVQDSVGVAHQDVLLAFADAAVGRDEAALARSRAALLAALGPEALVDAAGVIGNFERMNRIADACGISLGILEFFGNDVRRELDIEHYNSATNTKPTRGLKRLLGKIMARIVRRRMMAMARRQASEGERK